MKPLIIIIELLLLAAECMGAERGKPFVPPKQVPELRLVVDTAPVGSAAACPMDASVLVQVMDEAMFSVEAGRAFNLKMASP